MSWPPGSQLKPRCAEVDNYSMAKEDCRNQIPKGRRFLQSQHCWLNGTLAVSCRVGNVSVGTVQVMDYRGRKNEAEQKTRVREPFVQVKPYEYQDGSISRAVLFYMSGIQGGWHGGRPILVGNLKEGGNESAHCSARRILGCTFIGIQTFTYSMIWSDMVQH